MKVIFSVYSPVLQQYQNPQVITIQRPQQQQQLQYQQLINPNASQIQQQQRIYLQQQQQPASPLPQQQDKCFHKKTRDYVPTHQ
jgi:hypothetical protein